MKMMFQTLLDCGVNLDNAIQLTLHKSEPLDMKDFLRCFTMDVIGSCAFGLDCNSFENPNSDFIANGKRAIKATRFEMLQRFFLFNFPNFSRNVGMKMVPESVSKFYLDIVRQTIELREKSKSSRKDFIQILIDLKNKARDSGSALTFEEIAAQAFVFFIAGFETSSTTMTFCLFELAQNQEVQRKVRDELNIVLEKYGGNLTYEALHEMKYMEMAIDGKICLIRTYLTSSGRCRPE